MPTRKKKTATRRRTQKPDLTVEGAPPPAPPPGSDPTYEDYRAAAALLRHHGSPVAVVLETMAEEAEIDDLVSKLGPLPHGATQKARATFRTLIRSRSDVVAI